MRNFAAVITLLVISLISYIAKADFIVYKTYQDFLNKKGEKYDEYTGYSHGMKTMYLHVKKEGKKDKVSCDDIWGFAYNDALFRIDKYSTVHIPYRIMSAGKIIYYENGLAHLDMLNNNKSTGEYEFGRTWLFSADLNSEMTGLSKKDRNALLAHNHSYNTLFNCIDKAKDFDQVRECVASFNKE